MNDPYDGYPKKIPFVPFLKVHHPPPEIGISIYIYLTVLFSTFYFARVGVPPVPEWWPFANWIPFT